MLILKEEVQARNKVSKSTNTMIHWTMGHSTGVTYQNDQKGLLYIKEHSVRLI
jgi:hypothetical protein